MGELESFWHGEPPFDTDPLIRMALIHHQFKSIHPFYDGNGRTGRIVNVLYLVKEGLLDIPVLYILEAVERTATETVATIQAIKTLLLDTKQRIRAEHKFYSQDLINNLFSHPYTKIEFIQRDLGVSRLTATKYLDALVASGFLHKRKIGRNNYYVNLPLYEILTGAER